jgi:molybdate transport system regulatory protein
MNYKIKSRIWIEIDGEEFLGEGKVQLLKAINEKGSLSKAAKLMKISYKKAWHLLDSVNKSSKKPVTVMSIGGKGGGGTELTEYGKSLILVFEEMNKQCWKFLDVQLDKIKSL